jgi:hypothetical protein
MAWALTDPSEVPHRVQQELTRTRDSADRDRSVYAVLEMTNILTVPRSERLKHLTRQRGGLWAPGEEM